MIVTRREGLSIAPVQTGKVCGTGAKRARAAESSFDRISLSAGQEEASTTFRGMAAALSQQVRTYNTTGKIQDLRSQVASGEYRPDARETAARMLLMGEGE